MIKTERFFKLGLFAHAFAILLFTAGRVAFEGIELEVAGNEDLLNLVSVITAFVLLISISYNLTWPFRVEEALLIIVLWSLIGNFATRKLLDCPLPDEEEGEGIEEGHHHHDPHSHHAMAMDGPTDNNRTAIDTVPSPPAYALEEEEEATSFLASMWHDRSGCHETWGMFGIYFSILCLFGLLFSLLCDVNNRVIAFLFRVMAVLIALLVFVVPIRCNRFRVIPTQILIFKLTLYMLVWNANKYLRITEHMLEHTYRTATELVQPIYRRFKSTPPPMSRNGVEGVGGGSPSSPSQNRQAHRGAAREPVHARPRHKRKKKKHHSSYSSSSSSSMEASDSDGEDDRHTRSYLDTEEEDETHAIFEGVSKLERSLGRVETASPYEARQFKNYLRVSKINSRSKGYGFLSWKNRRYGKNIICLIDIARTIPILAICPIALSIAVLVLFWLVYCTRANVDELQATNRYLNEMHSLRQSQCAATNAKQKH